MRIAQRMISRNYKITLNNSLGKRAETLDRSATGLKFAKLSDNVADGSRAMHIQEERYQTTQQHENVKNLLAEMNAVDSNLESIHDVMQTIGERVLKGLSENYGQTARDVLAVEVRSLKEQIIQFANAKFGGKYLFSGTNNSGQPFTVDGTSGELMFNGVAVKDIYERDGVYYYDDGGTETVVPNSEDIYADIGLGLKISDDVQADPRTAFQVSFSGLDFMGFGEDVTGSRGNAVANNIYDMLTQIENALSPELKEEELRDLHDHLVKITDQVGETRTDLGTRMNFLERMESRLQDDIDNMTELETDLVSADPAEEAIKLKESEYVWLAVLQIGSQILPTSLLDFMS